MTCMFTIRLVCDHNTTLLKMGERLQSQKSYVCTFFDCKAKFSKSWKLEAHLCKHTGLVSAGHTNAGASSSAVNVLFYFIYFFLGGGVLFTCGTFGCDGRNPSPVRAAAGASAPATNSADTSSTTAGRGRTSELLHPSFHTQALLAPLFFCCCCNL